MWNYTDTPLAYLITFRCYGTWLHGDERGSIDRFHNRYRSPYMPADERRLEQKTRKLKSAPVTLDSARRSSVAEAVRETCSLRGWLLRAVNARTNHVHVVVAAGSAKPERALNALKANATRRMRQDGCWAQAHSPWADKGSVRYLWNERNVERAVEYVVTGQGGALTDFD